jgi:hypothetical protein
LVATPIAEVCARQSLSAAAVITLALIEDPGPPSALDLWWFIIAAVLLAALSGAIGGVVFARSRRQYDQRALQDAASHF